MFKANFFPNMKYRKSFMETPIVVLRTMSNMQANPNPCFYQTVAEKKQIRVKLLQ